jgi:hypothetical protein
VIWKLRNRACFEGKLINSPIDLICYATVFMKYWAGLNPGADQEAIHRGADALINVATGSHMGARSSLRIEGVRSPRSGQDEGGDARPGRAREMRTMRTDEGLLLLLQCEKLPSSVVFSLMQSSFGFTCCCN